MNSRAIAALAVLWLCAVPRTALAQADDGVGVRAQGMAGAFTAVADDATATWWNPAGLAGGAYVSALVETSRLSNPPTAPAGGPAWRGGWTGIAAAFPALGLSYYRLRISEIRPPASTATAGAGRQDQGLADLRTLVVHQFGATVGQSLGDHLVVATTVKVLHGGAGVQRGASGSFDAADALETAGETHAGIDLGAMVTFGIARAGVSVRNVTSPEFSSGADTIVLQRHARAGVALMSASRDGALSAVTVAADVDLTSQATAIGDERRVAGGAEVWTASRRFGLRGGASVSTLGDARAAVSGGVSVALRNGIYADLAATGGPDSGRRGWSGGLRLTF